MRSSNCRSVDWRFLDSYSSNSPLYDNLKSCNQNIKNNSKLNNYPSQIIFKSTSTNPNLLNQQQFHPINLKPENEQPQQQLSGFRKPRDSLRQKNNNFLTQNTTECQQLYQSLEIEQQSKEDSSTMIQQYIPSSENKRDSNLTNHKSKTRKNTQYSGATLLPIQLNDYRNLLREALQSIIVPPKPVQVPSKSVNLNSLKELLLSSKSCFFPKNKNININHIPTLNTKSNRNSEDQQQNFKSPMGLESPNNKDFYRINEKTPKNDITSPQSSRRKNILSPIQFSQLLKRESCPESFLKDSFSCEPMNICKREDKVVLPLKKSTQNEETIKLKEAQTSQKAFFRRESVENKHKATYVQLKLNFTNQNEFGQNSQNFQDRQHLNHTKIHEIKVNQQQQQQQQSQENTPTVVSSKLNSKIFSSSSSPKKMSFVKFSPKNNNYLPKQQSERNKSYLSLEDGTSPQEFYFNDMEELQPWKQLNSSGIMETFQQDEEEDDNLKNE